MFVHHVFFWMKPDATPEEQAQLAAGLNTLKSIEVMRQIHIGTPADTNRPVIDTSYTFSLLTMFDNGADEAIYQTHPVHLAFIDACKHLWERVLIYDSVDLG
jgi:Stress responsive A/B Barrel Domain